MNKREWDSEVIYCERVAKTFPVEAGNFNHDRSVFRAYCEMQAAMARREGFGVIAQRIDAARKRV